MHACAHARTHVHARTCTHARARTHMHARTHTHAHAHARTRTRAHTHAHARTRTHACTHALPHAARTRAHTCTRKHARARTHERARGIWLTAPHPPIRRRTYAGVSSRACAPATVVGVWVFLQPRKKRDGDGKKECRERTVVVCFSGQPTSHIRKRSGRGGARQARQPAPKLRGQLVDGSGKVHVRTAPLTRGRCLTPHRQGRPCGQGCMRAPDDTYSSTYTYVYSSTYTCTYHTLAFPLVFPPHTQCFRTFGGG
jgi:hypothetical protein